jgi:nitroreductase
MDAIECLKTRRSVRAYLDTPVPKEIIEDLVDCGRLAATAINIQPWVFIAITDASTRKTLADTADFLEDGSAATQNILNAARAHGLGSCWVAGDKKPYAPKIAEMLGVPSDYKLISLIAIGHPAQIPSPAKKALSEVLRWERF